MHNEEFETVIGLEIHVQLDLSSKIFAPEQYTYGDTPNLHISPVSLGLPGTLPVLHPGIISSAIFLSLALRADLSQCFQFDRKHYFYPDLPKGYQITQDRSPISTGGRLMIFAPSGPRPIRIDRFHLEEDAGKLLHEEDPAYSYIDYNRAGAPLIEIVTQPDLRSPEEVLHTIAAMQQLVQYLGISNADMEKGEMRCDCNVSVRPQGAKWLGPRCEIKNLNSKRFARDAVEAEANRQKCALREGKKIMPMTLRYDPRTQRTSPLRSKETALDYRYFPEPDLPVFTISETEVATHEQSMPILPEAAIKILQDAFGVSYSEAVKFAKSKPDLEAVLEIKALCTEPKLAYTLYLNKIRPWLQQNDLAFSQFPVRKNHIRSLLELIENQVVSKSAAFQRLFPAMLESPETPPAELVKSLNLIQTDDAIELERFVRTAFQKHPDKVLQLRSGKKNLVGLFMGEVMRMSNGKAHPGQARRKIHELARTFSLDDGDSS